MTVRPLIVLLLILSGVATAQAATVHGNVYEWSTLEPLNDVIMEINTVPVQTMVVKDGTYSFEVPPGSYTIEARYYRDNLLEYYSEDNITVAGEGIYVFDVILFPSLDVEEFFPEENLSLDEILAEGESPSTSAAPAPEYPALTTFIVFAVATAAALYLWLRRKNRADQRVSEDVLPEDLKRVLQIIEKNQGRITQKDLRKELDLSEAKVSLMITDLESRGLVKRIKKGRGNVIIRQK